MGSKLQHVSSLPSHNRATPIPAEACSQPIHFSQRTNKACPTRNWAACSNSPQKCSFRFLSAGKQKGHGISPHRLGLTSSSQAQGCAKQGEVCVSGAGVRAGCLRDVLWLPALMTRDGFVQKNHCPPLLQPQQKWAGEMQLLGCEN